jgi:hypothetical protein
MEKNEYSEAYKLAFKKEVKKKEKKDYPQPTEKQARLDRRGKGIEFTCTCGKKFMTSAFYMLKLMKRKMLFIYMNPKKYIYNIKR